MDETQFEVSVLASATQLHKVASGRIFVREARAEPAKYDDHVLRQKLRGAQLILGVVEIPNRVDVERMHSVRLNSSLWMDADVARRPNTHTEDRDIAEMDMANVLTDFKFSAGGLPDAFEVFVRATHIKHDRGDMRWVYIAGLLSNPLTALPKQGLYEFSSSRDGFRLLSENIYAGDALSTVFRRPLWGPSGQFGMATSLEPTGFPAWLVSERAMQSRRSYADPLFEKYKRVLFERHPELADQLVYTADQDRQREVITTEILREVMRGEEGSDPGDDASSAEPEVEPSLAVDRPRA